MVCWSGQNRAQKAVDKADAALKKGVEATQDPQQYDTAAWYFDEAGEELDKAASYNTKKPKAEMSTVIDSRKASLDKLRQQLDRLRKPTVQSSVDESMNPDSVESAENSWPHSTSGEEQSPTEGRLTGTTDALKSPEVRDHGQDTIEKNFCGSNQTDTVLAEWDNGQLSAKNESHGGSPDAEVLNPHSRPLENQSHSSAIKRSHSNPVEETRTLEIRRTASVPSIGTPKPFTLGQSHVDEAKSPRQVNEAKSPRQVDEAKSPRQVDEAKSPRHVDEAKSPRLVDEPAVEMNHPASAHRQFEEVYAGLEVRTLAAVNGSKTPIPTQRWASARWNVMQPRLPAPPSRLVLDSSARKPTRGRIISPPRAYPPKPVRVQASVLPGAYPPRHTMSEGKYESDGTNSTASSPRSRHTDLYVAGANTSLTRKIDTFSVGDGGEFLDKEESEQVPDGNSNDLIRKCHALRLLSMDELLLLEHGAGVHSAMQRHLGEDSVPACASTSRVGRSRERIIDGRRRETLGRPHCGPCTPSQRSQNFRNDGCDVALRISAPLQKSRSPRSILCGAKDEIPKSPVQCSAADDSDSEDASPHPLGPERVAKPDRRRQPQTPRRNSTRPLSAAPYVCSSPRVAGPEGCGRGDVSQFRPTRMGLQTPFHSVSRPPRALPSDYPAAPPGRSASAEARIPASERRTSSLRGRPQRQPTIPRPRHLMDTGAMRYSRQHRQPPPTYMALCTPSPPPRPPQGADRVRCQDFGAGT